MFAVCRNETGFAVDLENFCVSEKVNYKLEPFIINRFFKLLKSYFELIWKYSLDEKSIKKFYTKIKSLYKLKILVIFLRF